MRKIGILLPFLMVSCICLAQNFNNPAESIIPPPPNASTLAKYGDIPVGRYNGTTEISVPIHSLQGKELTLPISLSYHASGFRVNEFPGWVGSNWTLNAGGVITRTVFGLPDDAPYGYMHLNSQTNVFPNELDPAVSPPFYPNTERYGFLERVGQDCWDAQPDIFYFNFNGRAGKFVIDKNNSDFQNTTLKGRIHTIPYQNLDIQCSFTGNDISGFTVVTEDGTSYLFNNIENTTVPIIVDDNAFCPRIDKNFNSSWYLTEIRAPRGEKIAFHYEDYTYSEPQPSYEEFFVNISDLLDLSGVSCWDGIYRACKTPPDVIGSSLTANLNLIRGKLLTQINLNNYSVEFDYNVSTGTSSYVGDRLLENIKCYYKSNNTKTVILDYMIKDQRPFLEKIKNVDPSDVSIVNSAYKLEYDLPSTVSLPAYDSKSIDHWGFFNGQNNTYLTPALDIDMHTIDPNIITGGILHHFDGGNREPVAAMAGITMLKKIIYPTGGSSEFTYEGNNYSYVGQTQVPITQNVSNQQASANVYTSAQGGGDHDLDEATTFIINDAQSVKFIAKSDHLLHTCSDDDPGFPTNQDFHPALEEAWLTNEANPNTTLTPLHLVCNTCLNCDDYCESENSLWLTPGTYRIHVKLKPQALPCKHWGWAAVNYVNFTTTDPNKPVGGVRIKQIVTYDGLDHNRDIIKQYEYNLSDNPFLSSGDLLNEPQYSYLTYGLGIAKTAEYGPNDCSFFIRKSSSIVPLSSVTGGFLGYREVVERMGTLSDNNGYSRNFFTSAFDYPDNQISPYIGATITTHDYKRGLEIKSQTFNKYSELRSEHVNNYSYNDGYGDPNCYRLAGMSTRTDNFLPVGCKLYDPYTFENISTACFYTIMGQDGCINDPDINYYHKFNWNLYSIISAWTKLASTSERKFDEDGNYLENKTDYFYDNPSHAQLTRQRTTNSDGKIYTSYISYPNDIDDPNTTPTDAEMSAIKEMAEVRHMIGYPVEKITTVKSSSSSTTENVLTAELNSYKAVSPINTALNDFVAPYRKFEGKQFLTGFQSWPRILGSNASFNVDPDFYIERSVMDKYDDYGDLLTMYRTKDINQNIQWAYKAGDEKTLPEASFTNALHSNSTSGNIGSEFSYCGFESGLTGYQEENDYWPVPTNGLTNTAHTGNESVIVFHQTYMERVFVPENQHQQYKFSGWYKANVGETNAQFYLKAEYPNSNDMKIVSTKVLTTGTAWKYYELIMDLSLIENPGGLIKLYAGVSGDGSNEFYWDDIRFQPVLSNVKTATYRNGQVSSISDENNVPTYFEYDEFQRVKNFLDQDRNIRKHFAYHYHDNSNNVDLTNGDLNYVSSDDILTQLQSESGISNLSLTSGDRMSNKGFLDGLGRDIQTLLLRQSPFYNSDIINPKEYDHFGREVKSYLPYVRPFTSSNFEEYWKNNQPSFYQSAPNEAHTNYPFTESVFDGSPLNELREESAPGESWKLTAGHTTHLNQRYNSEDEVLLWKFNSTSQQWEASTYYQSSQLVAEEMQDENGHWVVSFKDKRGKLICKYAQKTEPVGAFVSNVEDWQLPVAVPPVPLSNYRSYFAITYYVYDDKEHLRCIIPPAATSEMITANSFVLTTGILSKWIIRYAYDERGRLIEKKIPGKEAESTIYDLLDRPVLTQDGNLNVTHKWKFIKYDVLSRPLVTGLYEDNNTNHLSRETMQNYATGLYTAATNAVPLFERKIKPTTTSTNFGDYITNESFPTITTDNILSVNFYDDYDYDCDGTNNTDFISENGFVGAPLTNNILVKLGSTTLANFDNYVQAFNRVSCVTYRNIDASNALSTAWSKKVSFCDKYSRIINNQSDNHVGQTDFTYTDYNFNGKPTSTLLIQNYSASQQVRVKNRYEYDQALRLKKVFQKNGSGDEIVLSQMNYNALGQLIEKNLHSNTAGTSGYLQSVDYKYNIRGWLTHINEPGCINLGCAIPSQWHPVHINPNVFDWFDVHIDTKDVPVTPPVLNPHMEARSTSFIASQRLAQTGWGESDFEHYSFSLADSLTCIALINDKYPDSLLTSSNSSDALPSGEFSYYLEPYILYGESLTADAENNHNTGYAGKLFNHVRNFIVAKTGISYDSLIAITNYGVSGNRYLELKSKYQAQLADTTNHSTWRGMCDSIATNIVQMLKESNVTEQQFRNFAYTMDSTNRELALNLYSTEELFDSIAGEDYLYLMLRSEAHAFAGNYDTTCIKNNSFGVYKAATVLDTTWLKSLSGAVKNYDSLQIVIYDSLNAASDLEKKLYYYQRWLPSGLKQLVKEQYSGQIKNTVMRQSRTERLARFQKIIELYNPELNEAILANASNEFRMRFNQDLINYISPLLKHTHSNQKRKDIVIAKFTSYITILGDAACSALQASNEDNPDLFAMEMKYDQKNAELNAPAQYNGNISQAKWIVNGANNTDAYGYAYDPMNRLRRADYGSGQCKHDLVRNTRFDNPLLTYDDNGNIIRMKQNGVTGLSGSTYSYGTMDDLTYYTFGNQLIGVNDATTVGNAYDFKDNGNTGTPSQTNTTNWEYIYDFNGNTTQDKNKAIRVTYNILDLPAKIIFDNTNDEIDYEYDATGTLIKQTIIPLGNIGNATTKDYILNFVYENGALSYFTTDEGRTVNDNGTLHYEYSIKDHLGNTRVCLADNNNDWHPELLQREDYYPFGLEWAGPQHIISGLQSKKLFNQYDFEDFAGLNTYRAFYRNYDPQVGRWWQIDPKTEKYEEISPYVSMNNNPILHFDILGDQPGNTLWQNKINGTSAESMVFNQLSASGEFAWIQTQVGVKSTVSGQWSIADFVAQRVGDGKFVVIEVKSGNAELNKSQTAVQNSVNQTGEVQIKSEKLSEQKIGNKSTLDADHMVIKADVARGEVTSVTATTKGTSTTTTNSQRGPEGKSDAPVRSNGGKRGENPENEMRVPGWNLGSAGGGGSRVSDMPEQQH